MSNKTNLKNWVHDAKHSGLSDTAIKHRLSKAGHSKKDIESALEGGFHSLSNKSYTIGALIIVGLLIAFLIGLNLSGSRSVPIKEDYIVKQAENMFKDGGQPTNDGWLLKNEGDAIGAKLSTFIDPSGLPLEFIVVAKSEGNAKLLVALYSQNIRVEEQDPVAESTVDVTSSKFEEYSVKFTGPPHTEIVGIFSKSSVPVEIDYIMYKVG